MLEGFGCDVRKLAFLPRGLGRLDSPGVLGRRPALHVVTFIRGQALGQRFDREGPRSHGLVVSGWASPRPW